MGRNTFTIFDDVTNTDIDFREVVPGSPMKSYGREQSRITSHYYVAAADYLSAVRCLLGYTVRRFNEELVRPYLHRTVPHLHPHTIGNYAKTVAVETYVPKGGKDAFGVAAADTLKLRVEYEQFPWDFGADSDVYEDGGVPVETKFFTDAEYGRWISLKLDESAQVLTTRTGSWEWEDTGPPRRRVMSDVPLIMPRSRPVFTWHEVPVAAVNKGLITSSVGKTNSVSFFDYQARTLILESPQWERTYTTMGLRALNAIIPMKHIPQGVNSLPDPARQNQLFPVISGDGTRRLFEEFDFYTLFVPR